ncbi:MAG: ABC transporter permease [Rickettsiales bacterium]|nr:ABC transporter permease [Rickettsiales bacterium]
MQEFISAVAEAIQLVTTLDADLFEIVGLSMQVSLTAVAIACLIGLPIGASLAITNFPGRHFLIVTISALMGLPPVVVGLIIYLFLSNTGPLGWLELLYSPSAMIIAQTILVAPIVAALSRQVIEDLNAEYAEQFRSLSVPLKTAIITLLWDARHSLGTVALAGFGRAIAEVGAVIIVGGNIDHLTRVMTTAIALETSKGNLDLALALGMILIVTALAVNASVTILRGASADYSNG